MHKTPKVILGKGKILTKYLFNNKIYVNKQRQRKTMENAKSKNLLLCLLNNELEGNQNEKISST